MSRSMVSLLGHCCVAACLWTAAADASARTAVATIARVDTAIATLERVQVGLSWPAGTPHGELRLRAARIEAPELGYRFESLDWRCTLRRDRAGAWQCEGPLQARGGAPMRLSIDLASATTQATLSRGPASVALHRNAASPDATRIDLTRVPLAWTQALLAKGWPAARISAGTVDSRLVVSAPTGGRINVAGPLAIRGAALDTPDGAIAAENLGVGVDIDASFGDTDSVRIDGHLRGGELLFGKTYLSLQQRPVTLQVQAEQAPGAGWQLPKVVWRDRGILDVAGSVSLSVDGGLETLDVRIHSGDLAPLRDGYLSAWLGLAGLGELQLAGSADGRVAVRGGQLEAAMLRLHGASVIDPRDRFSFDGLDGDIAFAATSPVASALRWAGGALYGLPFGPATLAFTSGDGSLRLSAPLDPSILGGSARFEQLAIRPPAAGLGLDIRFGLVLEQLDVARLSAALDWPAFTGELSGRIPEARYASDRLDFDGGLAMQLFGGSATVSALSMERPFGVAPTLSGDITLDDIDLESLTSAFDFGGITGKLDGRIDRLRLVDWQPVAFDAELRTDRKRGVRQRISQRAVQDLSSVGDASLASSLQSQLIGLFDDFGYSRIGIGCQLADEVCTMTGLGSAGQGFTIVRGAGLPRLTVVGFNRRVDWPTLVERLAAVGSGDVAPIVD